MTRAVGIVRQSRGDDVSRSPQQQREAIERFCKQEGFTVVAIHDELDVSGGRPLAKRPGLRAAVEAIESGAADVVVVAYFDRLVRSLKVQTEVVQRVEAAGGRIHAMDTGAVTEATAGQWLSGSMLGLVSEYHRRTTAERVKANHYAKAARGERPGGRTPFGYVTVDGRLVPDPDTAPLVTECFRMAASGATVRDLQRYLAEQGHDRSYFAAHGMIANPVYVGDVRFGSVLTPDAHEGLVARDVFRRVQQRWKPRGRRAPSDRLLARLGVLRCGTCGARMVVASATGREGERLPVYRCPPNGTCPARQAITAGIAEDVVVHATRVALAEAEGRAGGNLAPFEAALSRAESDLSNAIEVLSVVGDVAAAQERLTALRTVRDDAADALEVARRGASFTLRPGLNWDELTREERRELIVAVVEAAVVGRGRGAERLHVTLREGFVAGSVLDRAAESFRSDFDAAEM